MSRLTRAQLQAEIQVLQRRNAELTAALDSELAWKPAGVYVIKRPSEGVLSRQCWRVADLDDLDDVMPRAALLNQYEAIARAVSAIWDEVRQKVRADGRGQLVLTFPAPSGVADAILEQLAAQFDLQDAPLVAQGADHV